MAIQSCSSSAIRSRRSSGSAAPICRPIWRRRKKWPIAGGRPLPARDQLALDPDLLEAWNCLFGEGEWFPRESGIPYINVHHPDDDARLTGPVADNTGRAVLYPVDLADCERLKAAQKKFAGFIAQEIACLLDDKNGPALTFMQKGSRPDRCTRGISAFW